MVVAVGQAARTQGAQGRAAAKGVPACLCNASLLGTIAWAAYESCVHWACSEFVVSGAAPVIDYSSTPLAVAQRSQHLHRLKLPSESASVAAPDGPGTIRLTADSTHPPTSTLPLPCVKGAGQRN